MDTKIFYFCKDIEEILGVKTSKAYEIINQLNQELWVFCNSSLLWVLREFTGRCNLGGGMLKAEATDLKTLPLCFDLPIDKTARLFEEAKELTSSSNIEEVVNSKFHKAIDNVVFDYLGFDNTEREYIVNLLVKRFNWRGQKSKTK